MPGQKSHEHGEMSGHSFKEVFSPRMVIAKPAGEDHDRGAMHVMQSLVKNGADVTYLDSVTNAREVVDAAVRQGAGSIGFCIGDDTHAEMLSDASRYAKELGIGLKLFGGGTVSASAAEMLRRDDVRVFSSAPQVRETPGSNIDIFERRLDTAMCAAKIPLIKLDAEKFVESYTREIIQEAASYSEDVIDAEAGEANVKSLGPLVGAEVLLAARAISESDIATSSKAEYMGTILGGAFTGNLKKLGEDSGSALAYEMRLTLNVPALSDARIFSDKAVSFANALGREAASEWYSSAGLTGNVGALFSSKAMDRDVVGTINGNGKIASELSYALATTNKPERLLNSRFLHSLSDLGQARVKALLSAIWVLGNTALADSGVVERIRERGLDVWNDVARAFNEGLHNLKSRVFESVRGNSAAEVAPAKITTASSVSPIITRFPRAHASLRAMHMALETSAHSNGSRGIDEEELRRMGLARERRRRAREESIRKAEVKRRILRTLASVSKKAENVNAHFRREAQTSSGKRTRIAVSYADEKSHVKRPLKTVRPETAIATRMKEQFRRIRRAFGRFTAAQKFSRRSEARRTARRPGHFTILHAHGARGIYAIQELISHIRSLKTGEGLRRNATVRNLAGKRAALAGTGMHIGNIARIFGPRHNVSKSNTHGGSKVLQRLAHRISYATRLGRKSRVLVPSANCAFAEPPRIGGARTQTCQPVSVHSK